MITDGTVRTTLYTPHAFRQQSDSTLRIFKEQQPTFDGKPKSRPMIARLWFASNSKNRMNGGG
jgi:hypothetical protein